MLEFEDERDRRIYGEWTAALDSLFGERMYLHYDLYEATHAHRIQHNGGIGEGPCSAWPSPPFRAPMWSIVADVVKARYFLEIGCALGYTAALMAEAGGADCQVDTIENDPIHADLARGWLARKGLDDRVRVLEGDAEGVLARLVGPYDVVFPDAGGPGIELHLPRLIGRGGVLISKSSLYDDVEQIVAGIGKSSGNSDAAVRKEHSEAEELYRTAVRRAILPR